ncbi:conserved hypothetical protein [Orientia tsutsugamushi str. Boryong]|uniref:Uncharacterized protein n=1 Tax=Orientia tsutsugamushi (strain Boryong) TaxID=357244 RepID=A5CEL2_ORITB|nr:conserved hypothetical protein [Orientia tsutsugamushi str. Boryong]
MIIAKSNVLLSNFLFYSLIFNTIRNFIKILYFFLLLPSVMLLWNSYSIFSISSDIASCAYSLNYYLRHKLKFILNIKKAIL